MASVVTALSLPYRADLQGLRAIAIILVVLAHAGIPSFSGGFVGVDVFFVLSGYLISGLLLREIEQTGRVSLIRFYARRIKRLLPAMVAMMGVVFGLAFWLLSAAEAHVQLASAHSAATWTSNLYFAFTQFDYFDELSNRDLLIHTWSLGVEEQFYIVWPVTLLILFHLGALQKSPRIFAQGLGVIFLLSLTASLYWSSENPQLGFYMMPSRMWQFALGGGIHIAIDHVHGYLRKGKVRRWLTLAIGLLLIFASAIFFQPSLSYPGAWALAPSLGTALVIATGHTLDRGNPLGHPALVWVGDRSYSLYLWHWPMLVLGFSLGFQGQAIPTVGLILLAFLFSIISFQLIELPFWKGVLSHASPIRAMLLGLLVMAITFMFSFYGLRNPPQIATTDDQSIRWRMDYPEIYRMTCDSGHSHARIEPCIFGAKTATKTVVLLGDSIGVQWFSLITGIFRQPEWRVVVLTKSSCPIIDEEVFYDRIGHVYQVCADWRNAILDVMVAMRPNVLVMGSTMSNGFSEDQWVEGTSRILERLSPFIDKIILVLGTPNLGFDGPGCIARNLLPTGQFDRDACVAHDRIQAVDSIKGRLRRVVDRFQNTHLVDLNDLVCPEGVCNAVSEDGQVVFRDSQHLTDSFVRSTIPRARNRFEELVKTQKD